MLTDSLLTEKQVAHLLNISIKKVQRDRQINVGIRYVKVGRYVRYRHEDIQMYLASHTVETLH